MNPCTNHPDREAEAICSVCGKPFCGECLAPSDGEPVCFDCSIILTEKELGRERKAEDSVPVQAPAAARSPISPAVKALVAVGAVIILAELAVILFMGGPHPTAAGAPPALSEAKAATLGTVTDSIVISQTLESYRATHGHYPDSLSEIADSLPPVLRQRLDDPQTHYSVDEKGAYHLEIKGNAPAPVAMGGELKAPVVKGVTP